MISYCKNGKSAQVLACSKEKFYEIADSPVVAQTCRLLKELPHDSDEAHKLKQRLPLLMFMASYSDGHRHAKSAVPTGMAYLDLDELGGEDPLTAWQSMWQVMVKKHLEQLALLAHISCGGKGIRLVYLIPDNFSHLSAEEQIAQSKLWLAGELGVKDDTQTKDLARGSFAVTREYILYADERVFAETDSLERPMIENLTLNANPSPAVAAPDNDVTTMPAEALTFKGIPYSTIIREYWLRTGGEPEKGERNVRLHRLAVNLRAICDNQQEVLMQVMPRLGLSEQELQGIVSSACKEQPKGVSKIMESIVNGNFNGDGNCPPAMPAKLPRLIKLLTRNTPEKYKATVAHAVFPPLATHLCGVRFRYTDNQEHEATLMNCLMAGTGSGKSCIDDPIKYIMEDIRQRDKENERREEEWKKECQRKGANKDRRDRPEGLVIQMIDPDMTKPALVMRMQEAEGHFVYVKLNELDLFEQLKGQTGRQHFQLMCLAFDTGAEYGQTRIGTQSVTARPMCRFNWNACTTILKGRRFFSRVLTDGPISRINFCTIPEEEIGAEQPVFGLYDAAFEEELKHYIDRLTGARGLIDCPQAFALAKKLQRECADFARLSQNETYWNLSHRACVIAWLKACVLYVANGCKWERPIEDFIRWSLNYDLWCKMQFFGDDIEKANSGEGARIGTRGPRNLLELLPDEFTLDDAKRVRQQQGLSTDDKKCRHMITQWVFRKYVSQITDYSFLKSGKNESSRV